MKTLVSCCAGVLLSMTSGTQAASLAADSAADAAYGGGWTNGINGGFGFGAWQLTVGGQGGHFTASSAGNAGGGSGDIDTSGRSWGMWATNGVTEAVRSLAGGGLGTDQVLRVAFDNGWINSGRSVGFAVQNSAGGNLWEFYFTGGESYYRMHQAYGQSVTPIAFSGDGLSIEFDLAGPTSYLARIRTASGTACDFEGNLISQGDSAISRLRFWNYEAGAGSDCDLFVNSLSVTSGSITIEEHAANYPIVDTAQTACYDANAVIAAPSPGAAFAGQDAQYTGRPMSYTLSGDRLTVRDNVTGLTWTRSPDRNNDGLINYSDKFTPIAAATNAAMLNAQNYGGYDDWRLPAIKELYSLIDFRGGDPSSYSGSDTSVLRPFIDTNYFRFGYGDTGAGERLIDAQWATLTIYSGLTMMGDQTMFGVNLADGRIKGYPATGAKLYYVYYVRGNTNYAFNSLLDNGDGTVLDLATGLQWQKTDSAVGMNWQAALAYAEGLSLGGYQDWRLPNAKELQSIVDYTRCPDTTASPAIDPLFSCTAITNEGGELDYPFYWSSTTHATWSGGGSAAAYLCFGRGLGYFNSDWRDVHGAGAQRSDPKSGAGNPYGHGPQGDVVRVSNYVRCVRSGAIAPTNDVDGDGLSDWYEYDYVTNTTAVTPGGDLDGDGFPNVSECGAGTSPIHSGSYLRMDDLVCGGATTPVVAWRSVLGKSYRLKRSTNLLADAFTAILATNVAATPPLNNYTDTTVNANSAFYRVAV